MRNRSLRCLGFNLAMLGLSLWLAAPAYAAPGGEGPVYPSYARELGTRLALRATPDPAVWDVLLSRTGEGWEMGRSFTLLERFEIEPRNQLLERRAMEMGLGWMERSTVVGTVTGEEGETRYWVGHVLDVQNGPVDRSGASLSVFTLAFEGADEELARWLAESAAAVLNGQPIAEAPGLEHGIDTGMMVEYRCSCSDACSMDFEQDIAQCNAEYAACLGVAGSAALACIAACASTGPGYVVCMAGCLGVEIALIIQCLVVQRGCLADARRTHRDCSRDCFPE